MITIGIGDYIITNKEDETIITHSLGSCVALIIHCKSTKHTAMAHIALPIKQDYDNQNIIKSKPGYFATDIVPKLINYFTQEHRCNKNELTISLVGGAESQNSKDIFLIGKRNVETINKILMDYNIKPSYQEIGGNLSRTVSINTVNGEINIKRQKMII